MARSLQCIDDFVPYGNQLKPIAVLRRPAISTASTSIVASAPVAGTIRLAVRSPSAVSPEPVTGSVPTCRAPQLKMKTSVLPRFLTMTLPPASTKSASA